jgi:hypothetical protein
MFGRSGLINILPAAANVAISNVAGAPFPMYFAGALVTCYYPVSIASHGTALNVTVQSYNGRMDYGLIACRRAVPDITEIGDNMLAEHKALMDAMNASAPKAAPAAAEEAKPAAAAAIAAAPAKTTAKKAAARKPAVKTATRKAPAKSAAAKPAARKAAAKKAPAKKAPARRAAAAA